VAQAVARRMIPHRCGRIINIGSVTSVAGYAGLSPYGASRGGIRQLTMSLADDWGPATRDHRELPRARLVSD
jgi:NAD(P)-dependent dehydrogenase (short-subunit alcohol dehydrogenase family)